MRGDETTLIGVQNCRSEGVSLINLASKVQRRDNASNAQRLDRKYLERYFLRLRCDASMRRVGELHICVTRRILCHPASFESDRMTTLLNRDTVDYFSRSRSLFTITGSALNRPLTIRSNS